MDHSQRRQRKTPRRAIPSTTINPTTTQNALGATLARDVRVHPEDARDQREREQDHADHGEKLEPVLLAVRDDRLVRVLERLDDLLVVVEEVPDALGGVDDVVEVELEVMGEEALRVALEQAQSGALGLDDLAVRDDLLLRVGDVADDLLAAALLELVLDRVQLVPDLVQDREAVVEEVVEDVVEQVARRLREELVAKLVVLLAATEEVGDGQKLDVGERDEEVLAEEDVELGRVQPLDRLVVDREVEDDEEVLRVLVDLRPLPLREDVLDVELVEAVALGEIRGLERPRLVDVNPGEPVSGELGDPRLGPLDRPGPLRRGPVHA